MHWCVGVVASAVLAGAQGETWVRVYEPGCSISTAQRIGMGSSADEIGASVIAAIRAEEEREEPDEAVRQRLYAVLAWATNGARASDGGIVIDNAQQVDALARGLERETSLVRYEILRTIARVGPTLRAKLSDGLGACLADASHSVVQATTNAIRSVGVVDEAGRQLLWELVERPGEANAAAWESLRQRGIAAPGDDKEALYRGYAAGARISCGMFDEDVERWGRLDEQGRRSAALAVAAHVLGEHSPALTRAQHVRALRFVAGNVREGARGYTPSDSMVLVMYLGVLAQTERRDEGVREGVLACVEAAKEAEGFEVHAEAIRKIEIVLGVDQ